MLNENTNASGSSQIMEWLKELEKDQTFTAAEIQNYAGTNISGGAITGLIAKLRQKDLIREVGRNGHSTVYSISGDLSSYRVKGSKSNGSSAGRTIAGQSRKQRLVNTLFALVEEVEQMRGDLSDFTVKELLHELEKRTQTKPEAAIAVDPDFSN